MIALPIVGALASVALLPLSLLYPRKYALVLREVVPDPTTPDPEITLDPISKPGDNWTNPISSLLIGPGFVGWFQVTLGDNMSKLAQRLGIGGTNWRQIVAEEKNAWAVALCSAAVREKYYMGMAGIDLVPRYGSTPGVDCRAPGYCPGYPLTKSSNTEYPVLYWGGVK